ncbi:MAG: hypothetical protein U5L06_00730 [Rhodovibrio sp.]|nr:hypothetical protein [Rhodovibrio sp.]
MTTREHVYWQYRRMYHHPGTPLFLGMVAVLSVMATLHSDAGSLLAFGAAIIVYGPVYVSGLPSARAAQKLDREDTTP